MAAELCWCRRPRLCPRVSVQCDEEVAWFHSVHRDPTSHSAGARHKKRDPPPRPPLKCADPEVPGRLPVLVPADRRPGRLRHGEWLAERGQRAQAGPIGGRLTAAGHNVRDTRTTRPCPANAFSTTEVEPAQVSPSDGRRRKQTRPTSRIMRRCCATWRHQSRPSRRPSKGSDRRVNEYPGPLLPAGVD